jgi:hypothetical protein
MIFAISATSSAPDSFPAWILSVPSTMTEAAGLLRAAWTPLPRC